MHEVVSSFECADPAVAKQLLAELREWWAEKRKNPELKNVSDPVLFVPRKDVVWESEEEKAELTASTNWVLDCRNATCLDDE